MKRIFISDLHLDAARPDLTDAFLRFLNDHCSDIDELYILGDFFEMWLGDDDRSALNQTVSTALSALTCKKYIMHGNRDFLIGKVFCNAADATLLPDPTPVDLDGERVMLMHGDSLCTRDVEYMQARTLLRSDAFKQDFLSKPIEERKIIAEQIRGKSQKVSSEKAEDIMDVTPEEVVDVMNDAATRVLIHGHTHRPAAHQVSLKTGEGIRYVLGDWHTSMMYLSANGSAIDLLQYDF